MTWEVALLAAGTGLSVYQSMQQAQAQRAMYKIQSLQSQADAELRSLEFTERARRTLREVDQRIATNTTKAFAGGVVGNSGSTDLLNAYSMREGGRDYTIDLRNAELALLGGRTQSGIYNTAGDIAYQSNMLNAASTVVSGVYMGTKLADGGLGSKTTDSGFTGESYIADRNVG